MNLVEADKRSNILKNVYSNKDYDKSRFIKMFFELAKVGRCCECKVNENLNYYENCLHLVCKKCCKINNENICTTCKTPGKPQALCTKAFLALASNIESQISNNSICEITIFYSHDVLKMNKIGHNGENYLHKKCREGDVDAVRKMLEEGADPSCQDYAGWSPLHEAVIAGHIEIVKLLLHYGAIVNIPALLNYETPLISALNRGNVPMVELLIKKGADVKCITDKGVGVFQICKANMELFRAVSLTCRDNSLCQIFTIPDPTVVFIDVDNELRKKGFSNITREVSDIATPNKVTYLVASHNGLMKKRKYVEQAILQGILIVQPKWCNDWIDHRNQINPMEYVWDIPGYNFKKAAYNMFQKRPKLFDKISFYFSITGKTVEINDCKYYIIELNELIRIGGGNVLKRRPTKNKEECVLFPYHSNKNSNTANITSYVIYNSSSELKNCSNDEVECRTVNWLISCINTFTLIPDKF